MHNVLISLIEKLPSGYLMVLIPALLACAVWLFTHIRRDKQGKIYFYSQRYEDNKRNRKQDAILKEVSKLTADMVEMKKFRDETTLELRDTNKGVREQADNSIELRKDTLQLQICAEELPRTAKRLAYWSYKKLGHNSWVDQYVIEKNLFTKDELDYVSNNREDMK